MLKVIDRLATVLPPPARPCELPSDNDWRVCSGVLGSLPEDYRQMVSRYGTGSINHFMWVLSPGAQSEFLNIVEVSRANLGALRETREEFPEMYVLKIFPEPGGFLPCAGTDAGDTIYWETIGDPANWTIAVMGPRSPKVFRFPGSICEFLVSLLSGGEAAARFDDFPGDEAPVFYPLVSSVQQ